MDGITPKPSLGSLGNAVLDLNHLNTTWVNMSANDENDKQRQARLEAEAEMELNEELGHQVSNRAKDGKSGPLKRLPVLFRFLSIFGSSSQAGMSSYDRQED